MKKENKKQNKKEDKCPLCEISEETLKILKEKGKENKTKEKSQDNGK